MEETKEKREIENGEMEEPQDEAERLGRTQPWTRQITVRGVLVSVVIGATYSVIAMKLNLTNGLVPNLNVSVAVLAFVLIRSWTKMLHKTGFVVKPFTCQENTMIQTCAVACYSIAVGGGFASYLLGLNRKTYELSGEHIEGNSPRAIKEPGFGWMTGFLFLVRFVGLFVLIPFIKMMIVDLNLPYPSGLATAVLINGFHTQGDKMAKKQVSGFMKYFSISFLWAFFKWFFAGKEGCGFARFPTFGLQAWKQTFFFDFRATFVGAGMISSHAVNLSMLLGAVLSNGIMWPLINKLKGDWFPANLQGEADMKGLYGYNILIFTLNQHSSDSSLTTLLLSEALANQQKSTDDLKQNELFLREKISMWMAVAGYVFFSILSIIWVPMIFSQLKWYYVAVVYLLALSLAFCNAYGAGLTDINMANNYSIVTLFVLAALSGKENGVVAALAGCGLIMSAVSPRAIFMSQVIGNAVGCVMAPLSFFLFYKAFDDGNPKEEFKAALRYRNMAILGVQGFSALPHHYLQLCYGFFGFAVAVNLARDLSPRKLGPWMPLPMVMAVPFLVGAYFAIDMCAGSLIVLAWHKLNSKKAELLIPAVASGLICGEGLWALPAAILALAKINPSICMKFIPS
ncbi:hypothetical protein P3X46_032205 [Hevea brasiliensis]|uniref:Uncharacterized protein n=1 Tax=Hevea brasiliensis TaxID=3981 RepID=A0ABQ9KE03_HEVBR|nr:hypothetical protein P3X46_032205 [Hevea brasiliensis]